MNLNLQNAPVVIGLPAIGSNSSLDIEWPNNLSFTKLEVSPKQWSEVEDKLQWIKRQFEALKKNPKTQAYAPHVAPYLSLADLRVQSNGGSFSNLLAQEKYPLPYVSNLMKTLGVEKKTIDLSTEKDITGALIADRSRFRVTAVSPNNEQELGFPIFYRVSGLSYAAAFDAWLNLDFADKQRFLAGAIISGQAEVKYEIEAVLEPQLLLEGVETGLFSVKTIQRPTPGHGYALPKNLSDGGMLERCFDTSNEMYDLVIKDSPQVAPLLCLWGHRQRALLTFDQWAIINLKHVQNSRLQRLAKVILEKLSEKHPTFIEEFGTTELKQGRVTQDER